MARGGNNGADIEPEYRHPPKWLEHLAACCLGAAPGDTRLGDLAEQHGRTVRRLGADLGAEPWAMAMTRVAADFHYVVSAGNVMLFARAVDPCLRLSESNAPSLIAHELRERTMSMLRFTAQRLVVPAALLICSALLVKSAADVWENWRQSEALMASLQREKAESAAQRMDAFKSELERQVGWVTSAQWTSLPVEQRRFDYVRLLRQVPAITSLTLLDGKGHEQLVVDRLTMDKVNSDVDRSAEVPFIKAIEGYASGASYWTPIYYRKGTEPYVTVAVGHGRRAGVTVAEVNLKPVWDVIKAIKVGEAGYAYIVDDTGRLVSHPDLRVVLRGSDLSALPQVAAARHAPPSAEAFEGKNLQGDAVLSVNAAVPALGWRVFVDVPAAEKRDALLGAAVRSAILLIIGLVAAGLAIRIALRPFAPAGAAHA